MKRLIAVAVVAACGGTTTTPIEELNLDRPVDVAFACYGGMRVTDGNAATVSDPIILSAMPTSACEIRSGKHADSELAPVPPGQEDLSAQGGAHIQSSDWYAFILQQGPGTVVLGQFATLPSHGTAAQDAQQAFHVLDADPLTPGKNGISVGEDPIAIATDRSGCHELVANAGSCDLSVIDVASVIEAKNTSVVDRLAVTNASGAPIRSRPAAMIADEPSATVGAVCTANATGLVYIAYPSCHLIAGVDAASGQIVTGIQYDAAGVPKIVDGNVTCPDECGGADGTPGIRPTALDRLKDPRTGTNRMVIGAPNSASLTIVELDPTTTRPLSLSQLALDDKVGDLGVTKVAISPVIGMGGSGGTILDEGAPGGDSQFVYAIASDHTVRVADILDVRKECDTQVDPRFAADVRSVHELACMPVGDPATPPRRAGARGPGISLPGDSVPTAVAITRSDPFDGDTSAHSSPSRMVGYFSVITSTNGASFVVDIDDDDQVDLFDSNDPIATPMPIIMPHQIRDAATERRLVTTNDANKPECDNLNPVDDASNPRGGPHATTDPVRTIPAGAVAVEKLFELPGLRQLECDGVDAANLATKKTVTELTMAVPVDDRYRAFPDLRALANDENWTITYQGSLSVDTASTAANGPRVRESMLAVDGSGMHLRDQSAPYCAAGVEPFDVVQMHGCDTANGNLDCPRGYTCFTHPESHLAGFGTCLLETEADRLASACRDYLTSLRTYTVMTAASGELTLAPRRHELRTSPIDGCTSDDQCTTLANYAATLSSSAQPVADTTAPDTHVYTCSADPLRPPTTTGKRCELRCDTSADCLTGMICQGAQSGATGTRGFCMEGIEPPQACVNAPQRYELDAGNAFAVVGTKTGFVHPVIAGPNGACIHDPTANRLDIGRLPLSAPACDATSDPITGRRADGTFEPNPCSTTVATVDNQPQYLPNTCTLDSTVSQLVARMAPGIRFRNRGLTFTLIDPTYPGDAKTGCILDRAGGLGAIPLVTPGYQLAFRIAPGFSPFVLGIQPALPTNVVRGPTHTLWIIDQGDFLSTNITVPSTRGKVFRIALDNLGAIGTLQ